MVGYKLYVEGGGDAKSLQIECRKSFSLFLERAGLRGALPRVVPCGSRGEAFDRFRTAIGQGEKAFLLVDSEAPVALEHMSGNPENWQPWNHLRQRESNGWQRPVASSDTDCHLMVQVMESWFLADKSTLASFFGQGFRGTALPAHGSIETISKESVYQSLKNATRDCKTKASYGKGAHSFKILAYIDPDKVRSASPWAKRFIDTLRARHT